MKRHTHAPLIGTSQSSLPYMIHGYGIGLTSRQDLTIIQIHIHIYIVCKCELNVCIFVHLLFIAYILVSLSEKIKALFVGHLGHLIGR